MLSVREVHKSFGKVHAVRGVSFDVAPGVITGLLGPNGAGKSTTIRIAAGYLPADKGGISLCGKDSLEDSLGARRMLGYLPESAPSYPEMRVGDFLKFRAALSGVGRRQRSAAAGRVIERCWLREVRTRRIAHLSKGYRQRVGLAAALVHDPKVVILDEPANGLDPTQIVEMRRLIREIGAERTLLVSSHILAEVERTCDRVIIIARGRVMADGTPHALVARAAGPRRAWVEFAQGIHDLEGLMARLRPVPGVAEAHVESEPGAPWARVRLIVEGDPREGIAKALDGVRVRELHLDEPTLERVFMDCIEREGA
ncbi:MAG: ATP-binding cassette domain-containing protein [Phycisphaerales bacterium]|nr:ATP-binding cassette domain-containing protein [Phycisphaerales bacterium]